jgi:hypothetical protein
LHGASKDKSSDEIDDWKQAGNTPWDRLDVCIGTLPRFRSAKLEQVTPGSELCRRDDAERLNGQLNDSYCGERIPCLI